jgi:hypothetical protein
MTARRSQCEQETGGLLDRIEKGSEAIARLLQTCGSSSDFGPVQQRQFEKLLRYRQLITRLEFSRARERPRASAERTRPPSAMLST